MKGIQNNQNNLEKENKVGVFIFPDFKAYYKATVNGTSIRIDI